MEWIEKWIALSARIEGLLRSGEFVVSVLSYRNGDGLGIVRKWIVPEIKNITEEIKIFHNIHKNDLPDLATDALTRFFLQDWVANEPHQENTNILSIAALVTFRSEFDYLIRDSEIEARNRSEVAFGHLQRLITIDPDARKKWKEAFAQHETSCEKLGAVHLLAHGIFAFKITGTDSATDLAYNEPVSNESAIVRRSANALILTEWKLVKDVSKVDQKAKEARIQIGHYTQGVLGGIELKRTKFIVLVSLQSIQAMPTDLELNGITYRHINISVDPASPSVAAKAGSAGNPRMGKAKPV